MNRTEWLEWGGVGCRSINKCHPTILDTLNTETGLGQDKSVVTQEEYDKDPLKENIHRQSTKMTDITVFVIEVLGIILLKPVKIPVKSLYRN